MTDPAPEADDPAATPDRDVLVVGDVMVDIVVNHRGPLEAGSDQPATVELLGGGAGANVAAWLVHLGQPARLIAATGDDDLGDWSRRSLADAGVALTGPVTAGASTGTCVILAGPDDEMIHLPDRGTNDRLGLAAVVEGLDPLPGWLHVSGYALVGEGSRNAAKAALSAALAAEVTVSVDAGAPGPLRGVSAGAFLDWIEGIDLLLASDAEMDVLGGVDAVLAKVKAVAVKHGRAGATWSDGGDTVTVEGLPVDTVDTTGAGEAFAAGWITARRSGADTDQALAEAVNAGAAAIVRRGARPPAPDGSDADRDTLLAT